MLKNKKHNQHIFLKKTAIITILMTALISTKQAFAKKQLQTKIHSNFVSIYKVDNLLMQYCYNNVPFKPYVQKLYSPEGINILRDAPFDHLHHHGLMFAVAVDGINFWEEKPQLAGRQKHISFSNITLDSNTASQAGFTELINWENSQTSQFLLKEQRTIQLCHPKGFDCTLLTWQSKLQTPPEKKSVTLTGQRYFGLGMRFLESMDKNGRFYNADNKIDVNGTNNKQSAWCAYSAKADDNTVTVAMFTYPDTQPCKFVWFTMDKPFAYLAVTMNLHNQPLELTHNKSILLNFAAAIWDGQTEPSKINKTYKWWLSRQNKNLCQTTKLELK